MKVARVNVQNVAISQNAAGLGGADALPLLDDLRDVDTTAVVDGQTIVFDFASGTWIPAASGGDPADDTYAWMPLTSVVAGDPVLVWDGDDNLVPTLTPV